MGERRRRRRTPAGGVQAEKQQRYLRLIAQGISNSEACRIVRIHRRTGTRWRYGRTVVNAVGESLHYPAVKITGPKLRSPRYLSQAERIAIADLLNGGESIRAIGQSCDARRRRSAARSAATATVTPGAGRARTAGAVRR
jgi:IS30 family transposase